MIKLQTSFLGVAAAALFLPACAGDSSLADFSGASDDQLASALLASTGYTPDQTLMYFASDWAGQSDPTGCPSIVTSGATTTVTGGCDAAEAQIDGSMEITNLPGSPAYDAGAPTLVTADHLVMTSDLLSPMGVDGTYASDPAAGTRDLELTISYLGVSTTRLHLTCDAGEMCTAGDGSSVDIAGLGTADVEGRWHAGESFSGSITLHGADDIVFDLSAADADGCFAYELSDGASGRVCP